MSAARSFTLPLVVAALALCAPRAAADDARVARLAPTQDVSFPHWCEWGYDWDERCYRDDGDRLPVGGDEDKLWRAALRFATSSVPRGSTVVEATLHVFHDARCLAPRKTTRACSGRSYAVSAHPIASADWFRERELDVGLAAAEAEILSADRSQQLSFDLTGLVAGWVDGSRHNSGVLLKLTEDHEDYGVSGPSFPSSTYARATLRPQLEVTYVPPGG